jgi:hypothetical protein
VPHQERTLERILAHSLVLLVQDTTFLNYTHHPATNGLGPIGGNQLGLVMHSTLAFTPAGLPLGLLAQQIWARPQQQTQAHKRTQRPIAEKESYKWLAALQDSVTTWCPLKRVRSRSPIGKPTFSSFWTPPTTWVPSLTVTSIFFRRVQESIHISNVS